jgi:prepilin-type N-terminal cleavage/methylation domain-containing protein
MILGKKGITLAEVMVTIAIMGIMAAMTVPKFLTTNGTVQTSNYSKGANEFAVAIAAAYQIYVMKNGPVTAFGTVAGDLMQYVNYVTTLPGTSQIDQITGSGAQACNSSVGDQCYVMHNGAVVYTSTYWVLCDTTRNSYVYYVYDPDGVYGNSTTGISKSVVFDLHADGHVVSSDYRYGNICATDTHLSPGWGTNAPPVWYSGMN